MISRLLALALSGLLLLGSAPAWAQSQDAFVKAFSGKWQSFDQQQASGGGFCQIDLGTATSGKLPAKATGCRAPLASTANWAIEGSQLALYAADGGLLVKLGGNQKRINGATSDGRPIILERAGGDGYAGRLQAAYLISRCYYLGYSQQCAQPQQLGLPSAAPSGQTRIKALVNFDVHAEPRDDGNTVGVVRKDSCIVVTACTMASDGPWCEAAFGDKTGWLRKFSLRQNRWPVVTFANGCS